MVKNQILTFLFSPMTTNHKKRKCSSWLPSFSYWRRTPRELGDWHFSVIFDFQSLSAHFRAPDPQLSLPVQSLLVSCPHSRASSHWFLPGKKDKSPDLFSSILSIKSIPNVDMLGNNSVYSNIPQIFTIILSSFHFCRETTYLAFYPSTLVTFAQVHLSFLGFLHFHKP